MLQFHKVVKLCPRIEYNKCSQGYKAGKCHLEQRQVHEVPEIDSTHTRPQYISVYLQKEKRENTQDPAPCNALVPQGHQLHSVANVGSEAA